MGEVYFAVGQKYDCVVCRTDFHRPSTCHAQREVFIWACPFLVIVYCLLLKARVAVGIIVLCPDPLESERVR